MAGLLGDDGDAAHEGTADAEDMDVHGNSVGDGRVIIRWVKDCRHFVDNGFPIP
jgi:hypothetical protein